VSLVKSYDKQNELKKEIEGKTNEFLTNLDNKKQDGAGGMISGFLK